MKKLLIALAVTLAAHGAQAAGGTTPASTPVLKGEVLETKDVDAYTYLRLKTSKGEIWAAVNKAPVKKGAQVTIENAMVMQNFESKSLKRTFDTIVFGTLAGTPVVGAATPSAAAAAPAKTADLNQLHGNLAKVPEAGEVKVAKATGKDARTVAEVNAERTALKGKPVVLHAKVVKVTSNIMGKNWVHLRDGTGSASDGSNDLLVTSKEQPAVGDVVTAKGVINADVDLGSGYKYKVLMEDASFQK